MDKKQDIRIAKKYTKEYFKQVGKINYPRKKKKHIKKIYYQFFLTNQQNNILESIKSVYFYGYK